MNKPHYIFIDDFEFNHYRHPAYKTTLSLTREAIEKMNDMYLAAKEAEAKWFDPSNMGDMITLVDSWKGKVKSIRVAQLMFFKRQRLSRYMNREPLKRKVKNHPFKWGDVNMYLHGKKIKVIPVNWSANPSGKSY